MKISLVCLLIFAVWVWAEVLPEGCDVTARTEAGMVCGRKRNASNGDLYASFRGMRYAKAPLRELRFAEPQQPELYKGMFDATEHGPICPQVDVFYGRIMQPRTMDEDCLRINVNVPLDSLPGPEVNESQEILLPVYVFIHGGGYSYGSGDADLYGPEYLMSGKGVILVTFNYRLNVFGFLSLGSAEIPGNAGLRDAIFALKWVQSNIANFGGDPAQVTLGGQSAGATLANLIAMSPAVQGQDLFNRVTCFSGQAVTGSVSYDPAYTTFVTTIYLLAAGINIVQSPAGIHKDLIEASVDTLIRANKVVLDIQALSSHTPVIEHPQPGFTTVIPSDPEALLSEGYGKEYTAWLSLTDFEAESFVKRFREINLETVLRWNPSFTLPVSVLWGTNFIDLSVITGMQLNEYFNNSIITLEKYVPAASDQFFKYPPFRVTEKRLNVSAQRTYVSQFAYHGNKDVLKTVQKRDWPGAGHLEDITYFFRVNSVLGPVTPDELVQNNTDSEMRRWMTELVSRFVKTGSPVPDWDASQWPPTETSLSFQKISVPGQYQFVPLTPYLQEKKKYFDLMYKISRGL